MARVRYKLARRQIIAWLGLGLFVGLVYFGPNLEVVQSLENSLQGLTRWSASGQLTRDHEQLRIDGASSSLSGSLSADTRGVDSDWTTARVISRDSSYRQLILLDKGANKEIVSGMTVSSNGFYLGRVWSVEKAQSTVMLLGDPDLSVAAVTVNGKSVDGLVELRNGGLVFSHVLPSQGNLSGRVLITSGEGGLDPTGLVIGKITQRIDRDSFGQDIWGVDYASTAGLIFVKVGR